MATPLWASAIQLPPLECCDAGFTSTGGSPQCANAGSTYDVALPPICCLLTSQVCPVVVLGVGSMLDGTKMTTQPSPQWHVSRLPAPTHVHAMVAKYAPLGSHAQVAHLAPVEVCCWGRACQGLGWWKGRPNQPQLGTASFNWFKLPPRSSDMHGLGSCTHGCCRFNV